MGLNAELRTATSKLAENAAWYHLLNRIEGDISKKQALQGWKMTEKKIGKGTGKRAPALRREAQKLMVKCQTAVPAWIMPVNKALETLDPTKNKFDIIIIDEASQSDISALAIMYLAKKINKLAIENIMPDEYDKRRILCGNASNFQGDERDIIFLTLVDSNEGEGPLRMAGEGIGKSTKQRYNVAVSRAKNQIWVVHSLDVSKDLKSGDMRRDLIEYATDPNAFQEQLKKIKTKADSPFEVSVAKALVKNGYKIVQQWPVGSYRIDMVAVCQDKKIAIECDGELYHSGDEKIREDMERQAVLERLGWRFIRIRGSEYYGNPEETMGRVIRELTEYEIEPEESLEIDETSGSELQQSVIAAAGRILREWENEITAEREIGETTAYEKPYLYEWADNTDDNILSGLMN